jgi:hypothetical protein
METFTDNSLFLDPETHPELDYRRRTGEEKTSIHWGQMKLLMSEIAFFNYFWNPEKQKKVCVVYAGGAPGYHIPLLEALYPAFEFFLYDPSKFEIEETSRIHLFQQLFTSEVAEIWKERVKIGDIVFLISDIRRDVSDKVKHGNDLAVVKDVIEDMELQRNWYETIHPKRALLKFRLPYIVEGHENETKRKINYLYGYLMKQVVPPQTTTETRLIPVKNKYYDWDPKRYESQLFYHNVTIREKQQFKNPFSLKPTLYEDEIMNDFDSLGIAWIIQGYLIQHNSDPTPSNIVSVYNYFLDHLNKGKRNPKSLKYFRSCEVKSSTKQYLYSTDKEAYDKYIEQRKREYRTDGRNSRNSRNSRDRRDKPSSKEKYDNRGDSYNKSREESKKKDKKKSYIEVVNQESFEWNPKRKEENSNKTEKQEKRDTKEKQEKQEKQEKRDTKEKEQINIEPVKKEGLEWDSSVYN